MERRVLNAKIKQIILLLLFSCVIFADETPITLEHVNVSESDRASILRGAKIFSGTCMTCHTAKYLANNKLANESGITLNKMPMDHREWLFNVVPPDLSLVARVRGPDWLYTYFHAFYKDPSRPTGFNNLLVPNTVMTNIFAAQQGVQEHEIDRDIVTPIFGNKKPHYYQALKLAHEGSQSTEEFDESTRDIVNFLVYASDPHARERKSMGIYVLLFLAIFFVIVYLLKKLIWKNIK